MKVLDVDISKFLAPKSLAQVNQLVKRLTSNPTVPGSIPGQVSWKFEQKNFYRGRILIYGFPEPLGTKYHGLDTPVLGIQLFTEIHFGGVCTISLFMSTEKVLGIVMTIVEFHCESCEICILL